MESVGSMKVAVIGPGAMGCLFAGLLFEAGHDTWLVDKEAARAQQITRDGLRIDDENDSRVVMVNATADPDVIGSVDVVCVFVKSYDTTVAIEGCLSLIGDETVVLTLQNGAGNAETIATSVDSAPIVCGTTVYGSTLVGAGHVVHAGRGSTLVAPFRPAGLESSEKVAGMLELAGVGTRVMPDWQTIVWSKLVVNAAINALTVVSDVQNGRLVEDQDLLKELGGAALEAAAVAAALGINLMYNDPATEVARVCRATAENVSSMLQDARRGKRTEVDAINGYVVKMAHSAGVKVPINERLLGNVLKKGLQGSDRHP